MFGLSLPKALPTAVACAFASGLFRDAMMMGLRDLLNVQILLIEVLI